MGRSSVTTGLLHKPDGLKAYFAGTTSYSTGACFCYVEDAAVESNVGRGEPDAGEQTTTKGRLVEVPATASLSFVAGFAKQGGTGPGIVELYAPERGCILDVQVDGTTDVAIDDILVPQDGSHYLATAGTPATVADQTAVFKHAAAIAMEAETVAAGSQTAGTVRRVKIL